MIQTSQDFVRSFKAVPRVSTPIVAVRTPDPANAVHLLRQSLNGKGEEEAMLAWDIMRGLYALNTDGKAEMPAHLSMAKHRSRC